MQDERVKECFGEKTTFHRPFVEVPVLMDTWRERMEKDLRAELKERSDILSFPSSSGRDIWIFIIKKLQRKYMAFLDILDW